jgi:hypothetical protein
LDETGAWIARPLTWGGSGDALGLAGVNALLDQPPQSDGLDAGATVSMHLIGADYARLARATADAEESA